MYDDMETVEYNPPLANDELLQNSETIQYNIENDTKIIQWQVPPKKRSKDMAAKNI